MLPIAVFCGFGLFPGVHPAFPQTWTRQTNAPSGTSFVASSADGNKLAAVAYSVYTGQSTPAPLLNITPSQGNPSLSWIVPSLDFVLQQNSDLATTNWVALTNTPALNLASLLYQVMPSPTNSRNFYRLTTP
jgi:hypothetical protein